jgi:hypothetical protein
MGNSPLPSLLAQLKTNSWRDPCARVPSESPMLISENNVLDL